MAIAPPTTQRDQLLVFAAVAALALAGGYQQVLWKKKDATLDLVQVRIDTLSNQNEIARKEVARGTATKLKEEAEMYGRMLAVMRTLVPTANEVPQLINSISTSARRTGLDIGDIAPNGLINGDVFDTYKFRIVVTGSYHKIAQLITNIGSQTRIVAPMNVNLGGSTRDTKAGLPNEKKLDAAFEIQTYVAKASAQRPPQ